MATASWPAPRTSTNAHAPVPAQAGAYFFLFPPCVSHVWKHKLRCFGSLTAVPVSLGLPHVSVGVLLSVPLSAMTVRQINAGGLEITIGVFTTFLGGFTLYKLFA